MFLELARQRASIRAYDPRPVDRTIIDRCCEAARLAPSACNSQPWHFYIADCEPHRSAIAQNLVSSMIGMNRFALKAPVIICIAADTGNVSSRIGGLIKRKPFHLIDIGIAAEHFCLQATEECLGTCMIGWFNEAGVKKILKIPHSLRVPLAITMGYPSNGNQPSKVRKPLTDFRQYSG